MTLTIDADKVREMDERRVGIYHKREIWVEDVIDYFGDFVDRDEARELIERVSGRSNNYFKSMSDIRDILIERGHSVSFRSVYRRIKDE